MTAATQPSQISSPVVWHALTVDEVAARLDVVPAQGLTVEEAKKRLGTYGPNALAEAKAEPVWKAFLKHYTEYMQIVLVVAAIVSVLIGEWGSARRHDEGGGEGTAGRGGHRGTGR